MAIHDYKTDSADAAPGYHNEINEINRSTAVVNKRSTDETGEKGVFRAIVWGWFQGLTGTDEAGKIRHNFFTNWNPRPGCPLKEFKVTWDSTLTKGRRELSVIAASIDIPSSNVTRATTQFSQALQYWASTIAKYVKIPECDLQFLKGASNIGEAILPYSALLWIQPKYKVLMKNEYLKMIGKQILPSTNSDTKRAVNADYKADIDFIRVSTRAYGELVRNVFTPVITEAKLSQDLKNSPGVTTALKLLQRFVGLSPGPSASSGFSDIFAQAAKLDMATSVVSWGNRPFDDFFHVRPELQKLTPKALAGKMLISTDDATNTGKLQNSLPPNDDGEAAAPVVKREPSVVNRPSPSTAGFNWFTDDPRGQYKDCVLDKPSSQGLCAASWSFATTTMLDYRLCGLLKRNNLQPLADPVMVNGRAYRPGQTKLSNQICLSCTSSGDCKGGAPSVCLDWVKNNGLVSHACQPYKSWELFKTAGDTNAANGGKLQCPAVGKCAAGGVDNMRGNVVTALQTGFVTGLDNIRAALHSGPVTLTMAAPATFIAWGGKTDKKGAPIPDGIFSSDGAPQMDGAKSNHVLTVFGYGEETVNGKTRKFFLCLNSWGSIYNPFTFRRMEFNREENNKGPWFKLDAEDPALELDKYPAYWATPGLRVGGQVVPVNGKGQDGKPYWK
jgi:hypothetical protein